MVNREDIFELVKQYYLENKKEIPSDKVPVSGKIYDENELISAIDAVLNGWWTEGKYAEQLEKQLAEFVGVKYCSTVNSGSSANLLAFSALTSHLLPNDQRIEPGSEVISVAASFPTTVNPIIQFGAIPVFLDVDLETYNIKTDLLEESITEKTRGYFSCA